MSTTQTVQWVVLAASILSCLGSQLWIVRDMTLTLDNCLLRAEEREWLHNWRALTLWLPSVGAALGNGRGFVELSVMYSAATIFFLSLNLVGSVSGRWGPPGPWDKKEEDHGGVAGEMGAPGPKASSQGEG